MEEDREEVDFKLFELKEVSGERHSALRVPKVLSSYYDTGSKNPHSARDIFNILMADISGSMSLYWPNIVTGWQESIQSKLV
ncbi:hypothetical protein SK128_018411, partial [Halocaridina rubra]